MNKQTKDLLAQLLVALIVLLLCVGLYYAVKEFVPQHGQAAVIGAAVAVGTQLGKLAEKFMGLFRA